MLQLKWIGLLLPLVAMKGRWSLLDLKVVCFALSRIQDRFIPLSLIYF